MKSIYDISWQVSEPEYRKDPALSYSTLAKYEREGFDNLGSLFEHVSTPSLLLGSLVDAIMTGDRDEFDSLYYVANFPSVGEKEQLIAKKLFSMWYSLYPAFADIPYNEVLSVCKEMAFQPNWREDTRVKVLRERCGEYYRLLGLAGQKTVVPVSVFDQAVRMTRALHTSPATNGYFTDNRADAPVQRYYQLKFKAIFRNVPYRCMADLLIVDYDDHKVIPCDLKTSGHSEWNFEDSFCKWSYMIQARLYWRIIRQVMDNDDYFRNFSLEDYRFIVVNKSTLTPLVWQFPLTRTDGALTDGKGNIYRDPLDIGDELHSYLTDRPAVPAGISINGINVIHSLRPLKS